MYQQNVNEFRKRFANGRGCPLDSMEEQPGWLFSFSIPSEQSLLDEHLEIVESGFAGLLDPDTVLVVSDWEYYQAFVKAASVIEVEQYWACCPTQRGVVFLDEFEPLSFSFEPERESTQVSAFDIVGRVHYWLSDVATESGLVPLSVMPR